MYAIFVYVAFLVFIYIFDMWVCLVSTDSLCEVFHRVYMPESVNKYVSVCVSHKLNVCSIAISLTSVFVYVCAVYL